MGEKRRAREAAEAAAREAQELADAGRDQARALAKAERQGRAAEIDLMRGRLRALYRAGTMTTDQAIGAALALKVLEGRAVEIKAMQERFDRG